MFCILDISEYTTCDRIYRSKQGQRYPELWIKICKGKNMLFKIIISAMPAKSYKWMMSCEDQQLILVPVYNFPQCSQQFGFGIKIATRANRGLFELVKPPLAIDHYQRNFI